MLVIITGIHYWHTKELTLCTQAETTAKNRITGEVRSFGSACEFSYILWEDLGPINVVY